MSYLQVVPEGQEADDHNVPSELQLLIPLLSQEHHFSYGSQIFVEEQWVELVSSQCWPAGQLIVLYQQAV